MRGAMRDQQLNDEKHDRMNQCKAAMFDLGSRPKATARGVMREMKALGFTAEEIEAASQGFA